MLPIKECLNCSAEKWLILNAQTRLSFLLGFFLNTVYQQKLLYMFNFDLFNTNKKEKNLFVLT